MSRPYSAFTALLLLFVCTLFASPAAAFGAGTIKSSSALSNYNARHGDLANLLLLVPLKPGKFFGTLDVKRVYFGNWLRDFSQIFDVAGLTTIPEDLLLFLVQVVAYMQFGFATDEFEVTRTCVGVYRPEEHIDNPKGYPSNAQEIDRRLRGPVDPSELEYAEEESGMKHYVRRSLAFIEVQIRLAIELGRKEDDAAYRHQAMRSLGNALHCLEDFPAHTNYVELCLRKMSTADNNLDGVFTYTGSEAAPALNTKAPPIVTGTFGPLDLLDTLLGEVSDVVTTGSISEFSLRTQHNKADDDDDDDSIGTNTKLVSKALAVAGSMGLAVPDTLTEAFKSLPKTKTSFEKADWGEANKIPNKIWRAIRPFFAFRDKVAKWIEDNDWKKYMGPLYPVARFLGQLSSALDQMLYAVLGFVLSPVISKVRDQLMVVRNSLYEAQRQMHGDFGKSETDPSHSLMAKDHYQNVLNIPAAGVAAIMTKTTAAQVAACWNDPSIPVDSAVSNIVSLIHHPYNGGGATQNSMFECVKSWWEAKSEPQQNELRELLSEEAILAGKNYKVILNPAEWGNSRLGLPKEQNYLQQVHSSTNRVVENLWNAFDNGKLGKLQRSVVEEASKLFGKTPSPEMTNPFDSALSLLPIGPGVLFDGITANEILAMPTMGNIAKTGIMGALREGLGPVRSVQGLSKNAQVSYDNDVIDAIAMLGPQAEPIRKEFEGMLKMAYRV